VGSLACIGRFILGEARGWHGFIPGCFGLHRPANTPIEARFTWGKCQVTAPRFAGKGNPPMTATLTTPEPPAVPMAKAAFRFHQDTSMNIETGAAVDRGVGKGGIGKSHLFESLSGLLEGPASACSRSAVDPTPTALHTHQEDGAHGDRHPRNPWTSTPLRTCGPDRFRFFEGLQRRDVRGNRGGPRQRLTAAAG